MERSAQPHVPNCDCAISLAEPAVVVGCFGFLHSRSLSFLLGAVLGNHLLVEGDDLAIILRQDGMENLPLNLRHYLFLPASCWDIDGLRHWGFRLVLRDSPEEHILPRHPKTLVEPFRVGSAQIATRPNPYTIGDASLWRLLSSPSGCSRVALHLGKLG
jgi:hypothetical protein